MQGERFGSEQGFRAQGWLGFGHASDLGSLDGAFHSESLKEDRTRQEVFTGR